MFELAGPGTVFLDEIGDMEPALQAKLLRVVQERVFTRVGGTTEQRLDARLIAATNRDPKALVSEGKLREDLYYRLNVFELTLPPLRERREDIPLLVDHLLARINRELRRGVSKVPDEAMQWLREYDWPGNVREL